MAYNINCMQTYAFPVKRMDSSDRDVSQSREHHLKLLNGPIAILWDIENCPVPGEVNAEDVAGNIRMAMSLHPAVRGAVTMFAAYGDFNHFPRKVREGCQRTGINLIDVPNGKKDASDKAILVDMFLFALDNPPPCTIFLITGDVDFAPALHKLGQRGYTMLLAIPAGGVSPALCTAGRYVWDWVSVARGEGLVPAKAFQSMGPDVYEGDRVHDAIKIPAPNWLTSDESDYTGDVSLYDTFATRKVASLGTSKLPSCCQKLGQKMGVEGNQVGNDGTCAGTSGPASMNDDATCPVSNNMASIITKPDQTEGPSMEPPSPGASSHTSWNQPGDIQGLKRQLVKLLSLHGGKLGLVRVPPEYCKMFGRPLYLAEYGSLKLVHLIEKMRDILHIRGEGSFKMLHLTKMGSRVASRYKKIWGSAPNKNTRHISINEEGCAKSSNKEGKQTDATEEYIQIKNDESKVSSSHESDTSTESIDREDIHELEDQQVHENAHEYATEARLEVFKQELQELLVSHACEILVDGFATLYEQRYGKKIDYLAFGVDGLETLLNKMKDVMIVTSRKDHGKKFIVVNCKKAYSA